MKEGGLSGVGSIGPDPEMASLELGVGVEDEVDGLSSTVDESSFGRDAFHCRSLFNDLLLAEGVDGLLDIEEGVDGELPRGG